MPVAIVGPIIEGKSQYQLFTDKLVLEGLGGGIDSLFIGWDTWSLAELIGESFLIIFKAYWLLLDKGYDYCVL